MKYPQIYEGEWLEPVRRGFFMKCCDCGLVHRLNFRLVKRGKGSVIQFQAFRLKKHGTVSRTRKTVC